MNLENLMQRYRERTKLPLPIDSRDFILSYNTGVASMSDDGADVHTLVENANRTLNRARHEGKECIKFFNALEEAAGA